MSVLFSELLLPGWAEGPDAMLGVNQLADASANLPCHSADPETFFAEDNVEVAYAKTLCAGCPMKAACLEGALSRKEPCGIWGGGLFEDGKVIKEKRAPGRPRLEQVRITPVELISEEIQLEDGIEKVA